MEFYCRSAKKFVNGTVLTPIRKENMNAISKNGKVLHFVVYVAEILLDNGNIELIPFKSYYFDRYIKRFGGNDSGGPCRRMGQRGTACRQGRRGHTENFGNFVTWDHGNVFCEVDLSWFQIYKIYCYFANNQ